MKKIAIFGSGAGSNAQRILEHLTPSPSPKERGERNPSIEVSLISSNKPGAGILSIAENEGIPSLILDKEQFFRGDAYVPFLVEKKIDLVVLAGFLWKIPLPLIKAFPQSIINIHPALLPKYGGKGMYGQYVHQAVLNNREKESGITIHYVDEHYDHGDIILQVRCPVQKDDTADLLAKRVSLLEHEYYPKVIESLLK